jgi:tetratricopeptide (TPR) repeat protein
MLLSKNGRYAEACALTEQRYEQTPNWETAVAAANAARRAGDPERAVALFAKGAAHDPEDITCWLEIGDIRLEQDRWADALTAYDAALAMDPEHQWALPSAFYCRHQLGVAGAWLASLREVANQEGCTCGLEGCLTAIFGGYGSSRGIARAEYLLEKLGESR